MPAVNWSRRSLAIVKRHVVVVTIATLVLLWWGIPTARQAYYDAKVRSMCAQDGGIKVYEQVRLPAELFDKWGGVRIPIAKDAKPSDEFVMNWETEHYDTAPVIGDGITLRRDRFLVVRQTDGKVLGEATSYARRGGDPIGPWEESSFRCPMSSDDQMLIRRVFTS